MEEKLSEHYSVQSTSHRTEKDTGHELLPEAAKVLKMTLHSYASDRDDHEKKNKRS